jgi:hypothetical protein
VQLRVLNLRKRSFRASKWLDTQLAVIEANVQGVVDAYREKLRKRLEEILEKKAIDENRLAQKLPVSPNAVTSRRRLRG